MFALFDKGVHNVITVFENKRNRMVLKKEENNEMRILIKGAGDLATGIAYELWEAGHEVVMTEIPIPLAVRRMVSFSRAVYEAR